MRSTRTWTGIFLVVVSAAGFGTLAILGRYAYADGLDALTILFLRFSLSAVVMAGVLAARREPLPRGRTSLWLVGMGALGYVGQAFCYFTALKYASAGLVALLLYLYPAFVAILSVVWRRETVTLYKVIALALALVGTALTVEPAGGQFLGVLLAILAAAIYSVYIMVGTQVMKQVSAIPSSTVIFAAAGGMSGLLMLWNGPHLPATSLGWATIGAMVLVATVLPVAAFLAGLERIGPTNAAMLSTLEPVVTVLLAASLLGETLKPVALLGGGLILGAVVLLTGSELHRPAPVPLGDTH
jgi:drug/metabolite transporter (DMT)-like permease